ncbi:MAG: type II toxin-antitoxin system RelE/ParE family toxin [Deltaproteobacteria bacterium]|nr:type II toxin-antitoxin system RelE/ParE family toxin [Deltaproteobacteria bacterium]
MIKSFKCKETERLFNREPTRRIPVNLYRSALRKLWLLDAAENLDDLKGPPGNRLEILKGDRAGQHSIRINDQFRLCFIWQEHNAFEVEIVDYH